MKACGDHGGRTKAGKPCGRAARNGGMCALHTGEATPGPKRTEERFTDDDIALIERTAATVQEDELAYILGVAPRTFRDMKARDPRISAAYKKGRVLLKRRLGATLLALALGRERIVEIADADGTTQVAVEDLPPDKAALFFTLKTQFGYRETDRHEHVGDPAQPVVFRRDMSELSDRDLERLESLLARLSPTTDG